MMNNQEVLLGGQSRPAIRTALCLVAWCLTAGSQVPLPQNSRPAGETLDALPAFEVASVKVTPAGEVTRVSKYENGRLTMRRLDLLGLISWAFDWSRWDIVVPTWAAEVRGTFPPTYDIEAEAAGPVPEERAKLMLRRLLAERFRFAAHRESRAGIHRVLRVAKNGPKLTPGAEAVPGTRRVKNDPVDSRIVCIGASIADLLLYLNATGVGGPIYDKTELSGRYNFTLDYAKYIEDSDENHRGNALVAARIDALRELGLEVVQAKIAVDTLVVDHVEKIPTEN